MDKKILFRLIYRWAVLNSSGRIRYYSKMYQALYKFYLIAGYDVFKIFIEEYCGSKFTYSKRSSFYKMHLPYKNRKGRGYKGLIEDMKFIT